MAAIACKRPVESHLYRLSDLKNAFTLHHLAPGREVLPVGKNPPREGQLGSRLCGVQPFNRGRELLREPSRSVDVSSGELYFVNREVTVTDRLYRPSSSVQDELVEASSIRRWSGSASPRHVWQGRRKAAGREDSLEVPRPELLGGVAELGDDTRRRDSKGTCASWRWPHGRAALGPSSPSRDGHADDAPGRRPHPLPGRGARRSPRK